MDIGSLLATIGADITDLRSAVTQANSELEKYAKKTDSSLSKVNSMWGSSSAFISKAIAGVGAAFATIKIADYIKGAALAGAGYETLGVVLNQVGKNANIGSQQMNEYAEGVRKAGIQMDIARLVTIRMTQAQIDMSKASGLARIAQDAAVIGNINSSEALERMIHGIQTAQVDVLRNIGINVSFEESYAKLGRTLGRELTLQEKMQARVNAVMAEGAKIAGTYEAAMSTAGKQLTSLPRYLNDFKIKFGEAFNPATADSVKEITELMKALNLAIVDPEVQKALAGLSKVFAGWVTTSASFVTQGLPEHINTVAKSIGWLGNLASFAGVALSGVYNKLEQIEKLAAQMGLWSTGVFKSVDQFNLENDGVKKPIPKDYRNYRTKIYDPKMTDYPSRNLSGEESQVSKKEQDQRKKAIEEISKKYAELEITTGRYADQEKRLADLSTSKWREDQLKVLKGTTPELEKTVALMYELNKQEQAYRDMKEATSKNYAKSMQAVYDDIDIEGPKFAGEEQIRYNEARKKLVEDHKKATLTKYEFERHEAEKSYDSILNDWKMTEDDRVMAAERYSAEMKKIAEEEAKSFGNTWKDAFVGWAKDWSKTLNDIIWKSEKSFKDILGAYAKMFTQMLIQKNAIEPLLKFAGLSDEKGKGGFDLFGMVGKLFGFGGGSSVGNEFAAFDSAFDPSFDTGGMMGSDGKKQGFPAWLHSGEVVGTPNQMSSIFGGSKGSTTNIVINAVDSKSFADMVRRNPAAVVSVVDDAMVSNSSLRSTMRGTL